MSEKVKAVARPDDLSALPPSEFGPHGVLNAMWIPTTKEVRERIWFAAALHELAEVDGQTPEIMRAIDSVRAAVPLLDAHTQHRRRKPRAGVPPLMSTPSDESVYSMLADCGCSAAWAARRLRCPLTAVYEAIWRLVMRRRPAAPVDIEFEHRKHRALAELSRLEIVR